MRDFTLEGHLRLLINGRGFEASQIIDAETDEPLGMTMNTDFADELAAMPGLCRVAQEVVDLASDPDIETIKVISAIHKLAKELGKVRAE